MKKSLFVTTGVVLFLFLWATGAQAQIDINLNRGNRIPLDTVKLKAQKKMVRAREKNKLKAEVKKIEDRLKAGKISKEEAESLKKKVAKKRAKNIEDQLDIIDLNIALLRRNAKNKGSGYYRNMNYFCVVADTSSPASKEKAAPHRTHLGLVISFGFNNAVGKGQSLDDSPYKIGGSRFFQIGVQFSTVLVNSGFLRVNYGLAFQFNGLKPTHDRYFVREGDQVKLEDFPYSLKKAKLRQDNLVIPVHFEIGPTNVSYTPEKFKLGLGGYAGVNLRTIQKLKYKQNGHHRKKRISNAYNTNNFIYGLSAYVGYDWLTLYVKYDLNPLFKDNSLEQHNVAAGLRFVF